MVQCLIYRNINTIPLSPLFHSQLRFLSILTFTIRANLLVHFLLALYRLTKNKQKREKKKEKREKKQKQKEGKKELKWDFFEYD